MALKDPKIGLLKNHSFSRRQLLFFVIIFAIIGGYILYRSFAAGSSTFGITVAGSISDEATSDFKEVDAYTAPNSGSISKVTGYIAGLGATSGSQVIKAVVYADNSGNPGALLGVSNAVTVTAGQAFAWVDFSFPSPVSINAGTVWMGYIAGNNTNVTELSANSVAGALRYNANAGGYSAGPTNPFGTVTVSNYQYALYATYSANALPADINGDGAVNGTDLSILMTNWGATSGSSDLNVDGKVNALDLSILLSNFGTAISPQPTVNINALPTSISSGASSNLSWSSTNATSCTASDDWSGTKATSGNNVSTGALSTTSKFTITCTGPGGTSLPSSATVTVTGGGTIPTHIETWAYDETCTNSPGSGCEGANASATFVNQWVTYAEGDGSKDIPDCRTVSNGCKAMPYIDPNRIYTCAGCSVGNILGVAQENWWLHQPGFSDSAHRITFSNGAYLLNQSVPAVQSFWQNYTRNTFGNADGFFVDDEAPSLVLATYGSSFSSTMEITSDAQIISAHQQMAAALTKSNGTPFLQVDNTLTINPNLPQMGSFQLLKNPSQVIGIVVEDIPWNGSFTPHLTAYYSSLLDSIAYVDRNTTGFIVMLSQDPSGSLQARRIQTATMLLGYEPGQLVNWEDLQNSSPSLAIWPEEGIYPTLPVQSMAAPSGSGCFAETGVACPIGGHNTIQVSSGVYRREYQQCYNQGVAFGKCAAIVNTNGAAVTVSSSWLSQTYGHQITMNGSYVLSGGTINLTGATFTAGSTTIPAGDAILLAP